MSRPTLVWFQGRTMRLQEALKLAGMNRKTYESRRALGWPPKRALEEPVNQACRANGRLRLRNGDED